MTDQHNTQDDMLHRNLERIGPAIPVPPDPAPLQRARWKQPPPQQADRPLQFLRRHKIFAILSGSGAVAAALGLCVLLMTTAQPVAAGDIYQELRAALDNGAIVTVQDFVLDLSALHGIATKRGLARVPPALPRGSLGINGSVYADSGREQVYCHFRLSFDGVDFSPDPGEGFDGELEMIVSLAPDREWGYVRVRQAPEQWITDEPMRMVAYRLFANGVYLKLDGLFDRPAFDRDRDSVVSALSRGFSALRDPARLDQFVTQLRDQARQVDTVRAEDGATVLTATGFASPQNVLAREVYDALFGEIVQVIEYSEGDGIRSARIEHLGAADGVASMQLQDVQFDDRLLDLSYQQDGRPGMVIDVSTMLKVYRQMFEDSYRS